MSLSLLIVDPDQAWAKSLKIFLEEKSLDVDIASNGKDAQLLVYKKKYQVVLLDQETQNHSCFEVLRYLKINAPGAKILMSLKDTQSLLALDLTLQDLRRLGANEILMKPIKPLALFKTIEGEYKIESWKDVKANSESQEAEEVKARDEEFTRIKFENFFSGSTTIYDLYIRLSKNNYVKILHTGEGFQSSRLEKYASSNLDYLYFKTADRSTYINFTNELLKKIIGTQSSTIQNKVKFTHSVTEKYLEQVFQSGLQPSLIEEGKKICENMYNLIQKEPELLSVMNAYEEYDPPGYAHLFLVSFFSVLTCKNLDWASSKRTTELVAMAGLLHDIGELKLPPGLKTKDQLKMTPQELTLYQSHPKMGADMLSRFASIPEPVIQIVYQHHENSNGEGFPNKLNNFKIYPPAKIVALNAEFVRFIMTNKYPPLEGLKIFLKDRTLLSKFDPLTIKALVTGFIREK